MTEEPEGVSTTDWRYEVANGDTMLGYDEWRDHRIEAMTEGYPAMSNNYSTLPQFQKQHRLSDSEMLALLVAYVTRQDSDDALLDFLNEAVSSEINAGD